MIIFPKLISFGPYTRQELLILHEKQSQFYWDTQPKSPPSRAPPCPKGYTTGGQGPAPLGSGNRKGSRCHVCRHELSSVRKWPSPEYDPNASGPPPSSPQNLGIPKVFLYYRVYVCFSESHFYPQISFNLSKDKFSLYTLLTGKLGSRISRGSRHPLTFLWVNTLFLPLQMNC